MKNKMKAEIELNVGDYIQVADDVFHQLLLIDPDTVFAASTPSGVRVGGLEYYVRTRVEVPAGARVFNAKSGKSFTMPAATEKENDGRKTARRIE